MFSKYIVININDLNYTLENNNNKYNIIAIFDEYKPHIGDIIYMSDKIINDNTILEFGSLNTNDKNITEDDLIKIFHDGEYITLQRYYG